MEKQAPRVHVTKNKRQEILQKHSNALTHYQPLIEQKFSKLKQEPISIGKVAVKDMRNLSKGLRSYSWQECENPIQYALLYPFLYSVSIPLRNQAENDFLAYWFNQDLYLSFNHGTEILQELLDQTVVHELSHGLWEKLGGEMQFDSEAFANPDKFKFANEGFASFCEHDFFRDLYPEGFIPQNREVFGGNNYDGERSFVADLVRNRGEEFLSEFPTKWRSFVK